MEMCQDQRKVWTVPQSDNPQVEAGSNTLPPPPLAIRPHLLTTRLHFKGGCVVDAAVTAVGGVIF